MEVEGYIGVACSFEPSRTDWHKRTCGECGYFPAGKHRRTAPLIQDEDYMGHLCWVECRRTCAGVCYDQSACPAFIERPKDGDTNDT